MTATETRVVALDPGGVTGIAWGRFDIDAPLEITMIEAVQYKDLTEDWWLDFRWSADYFVSEKFDLRNNDFKADLTALRIEGQMDLMLAGQVIYRSPAQKSQVSDDILKQHGLWTTGKQVDWEDGRDVNDAIVHLLGYVAFNRKHVPTLKKYFR